MLLGKRKPEHEVEEPLTIKEKQPSQSQTVECDPDFDGIAWTCMTRILTDYNGDLNA